MADATKEQIEEISKIYEGVREDWPAICTNPRMSFDKERDWAIAASSKSDYAANLTIKRWQDAQQALRNVGAIGVTLDPAQKLAYILPRDNRMIYDLSYMGLIDIAVQAGSIKWAQAKLVHAGDIYEPTGYDTPPIHRRKPFAPREERGEVIGVYVVAKTHDNDYLSDEMSIDEINDIRNRSQSWKEHVASDGQKKSPWASDSGEMQKKTVVKRAYKYWPRSEKLDAAIHYLNTDGGQGMDLTAEDESKSTIKIWTDKVNACTTGDAVAAVWKEARGELKEKDMKAYEAVRAVVAARNRELGVAPPPPATTGTTAPPPPAADPAQPPAGESAPGAQSAGSAADEDELYDKAVAVVRQNQKASVSLVQRHLQIGYNRACALIERMEKDGIVSGVDQQGQRTLVGASPAPTPAPTSAPAPATRRAAVPPPPPSPSKEAQALAAIDAATTYEELDKCGELLDALANSDQINELNDAFDQKLEALKKKFGHG